MKPFDANLFSTIVKNANAGFLIQREDGSVAPLWEGVKGKVIQPQEAVKNMLFGNEPDKEQLTKDLILALEGKLKAGPRGGGKRARKPKAV